MLFSLCFLIAHITQEHSWSFWELPFQCFPVYQDGTKDSHFTITQSLKHWIILNISPKYENINSFKVWLNLKKSIYVDVYKDSFLDIYIAIFNCTIKVYHSHDYKFFFTGIQMHTYSPYGVTDEGYSSWTRVDYFRKHFPNKS